MYEWNALISRLHTDSQRIVCFKFQAMQIDLWAKIEIVENWFIYPKSEEESDLDDETVNFCLRKWIA